MEHALISTRDVPVDDECRLSLKGVASDGAFRKKSLMMSISCHVFILAVLTFSLNAATSTEMKKAAVDAPVKAQLYFPRVNRVPAESVPNSISQMEEKTPVSEGDHVSDDDNYIGPKDSGSKDSVVHTQRLDRLLDKAIRLQETKESVDIVTRTIEYRAPLLTMPSDTKVDEYMHEEKERPLETKVGDRVNTPAPLSMVEDNEFDDPLMRYQEEIAMHIKSYLRGQVEDIVGCEVILKLSDDGKILNATSMTVGGNCHQLVSAAFRARRVPMPDDTSLLTQLLRLRVTIR